MQGTCFFYMPSGYLCGYRGEFLFDKINMEYPPAVPYVALRSVSAAAGVALVPCVFQVRRAAPTDTAGFGLAHTAPLPADHERAWLLLPHQLPGCILCSVR